MPVADKPLPLAYVFSTEADGSSRYLGEFALIDKYFARPTPSAILGPGDDCALLQPTPGKQLAS